MKTNDFHGLFFKYALNFLIKVSVYHKGKRVF